MRLVSKAGIGPFAAAFPQGHRGSSRSVGRLAALGMKGSVCSLWLASSLFLGLMGNAESAQAVGALEAPQSDQETLTGAPALSFHVDQTPDAEMPSSLETGDSIVADSAKPVSDGPVPDPPPVSVGGAIRSIKWEVTGLAGYMATINSAKLMGNSGPFGFKSEGWFSKRANTVGIDKLTHAFNTYLIAELLQDRMERKIGNQPSARLAAAAISGGLMFMAEISDGFEKTGGFSVEDITMNMAGAGFSVVRRAVPGLRDKLDYRMMIVPNGDLYTFKGRRHFRQLRYLFSLQLAGFEGLKKSPWRFVELHAGYYASGFTAAEEARQQPVRRHLFVGVGLNVGQLLFGSQPQNRAARVGQGVLRYLQLPYTAVHGKF